MQSDNLDILVEGNRVSESTPKVVDGRRKARIISVQSLYESEMSGIELSKISERLLENQKIGKKDKELTRNILKNITEKADLIDKKISSATVGFNINEMSSVDRNSLRVAISESIIDPNLPKPIIINESIEVASCLGSDSSGSLINGILVTLLL
ncbi:MAG: transcription antitermination factor NusB [Chloroflexi bacterium]|nr:transcription antitermination factor NusB [Chloroflexota bacterium]|tara:strand:+ start:439 stop:900 length:462 start_codon:yes stop_codon:yes gene_type:complete